MNENIPGPNFENEPLTEKEKDVLHKQERYLYDRQGYNLNLLNEKPFEEILYEVVHRKIKK